jgi:hypothetical protein
MPSMKMTLAGNPPRSLVLDWGMFFDNLTVTVDGQQLYRVLDRKELLPGKPFPLPGGDTIVIRLHRWTSELEVTQNGHPVPGSTSHPEKRIEIASYGLFFVGGMTVFSGLMTGLAAHADATQIGSSVGVAIEGLLFLAFGVLTRMKRRWALIAGTLLYLVEAAFTVLSIVSGSSTAGMAVVMRLVFLVLFVRGLLAFRELGKLDPNAAAATFS